MPVLLFSSCRVENSSDSGLSDELRLAKENKGIYAAMRMPDSTELFLARPYAERQLIAVAPDEVVAADRKVKAESESKKDGVNWEKLSMLTLKVVTGGTASIVTEVAIEAMKALYRLRMSGFSVLTVSRSEANVLQFPPGHPRDSVLYVGHPAIASVYYTPAIFHRLCFEHKFCEAVHLLMGLGATRICVEHVSGWSKEFSANLSVPLGATDVGASAGIKAEAASHLLYKATLAGTDKPVIPNNLVWYPHEPTWQQIAHGRLEYGLENFSLSIRYEDDFGINAGLKTAIRKAGLDLGGKFEDHQSTVWRIDGDFSTKKPRRKPQARVK